MFNLKESDKPIAQIFTEIYAVILRYKFETSYPDVFECCDVQKLNEEPVNGCMYSWYFKFFQAGEYPTFSPKYRQTNQEMIDGDDSRMYNFISDFYVIDNWQAFLIENLKFKN